MGIRKHPERQKLLDIRGGGRDGGRERQRKRERETEKEKDT